MQRFYSKMQLRLQTQEERLLCQPKSKLSPVSGVIIYYADRITHKNHAVSMVSLQITFSKSDPIGSTDGEYVLIENKLWMMHHLSITVADHEVATRFLL